MYNLPYISYGIFAFVAIAIGLLGFKKGLRAAVFSFFLTLATVGAIVGATIGLYDYISDIFSGYIKSHFGGNSQFNFSYIADAAKPQVIAICIAIGFIPVFGLLFGISYPIYRLVKKRDFPRLLKKTSANTKRVKPRREVLNKVGSITATTVTAISTGAVISTATSAALTNSSSFNLFNKISSWVSQGTTFGFGYDSVSLHRLYDFIPLTNDQVLMNAFGKILNPNSGDILTEQEIQSLMADANFGKLTEILNDSDVDAILSTISSQYDSSKGNPDQIVFGDLASGGYTQAQNKYLWRPLGNEGSQTGGYSTTYQVIDDAFKTKHLGINHDAVEQILNWIRNNGIQKFEDTKAYQDFARKADAIKALREELAQKTNELNKRKADLAKTNSDISSTVADLKNTVGNINVTVNQYNALVRGFATDNSTLSSKESDMNSKEANMQASENAFDSFSGEQQYRDYLNGDINTLFTRKDLYKITDPNSQLGLSRKNLNEAKTAMDNAKATYENAMAATQRSFMDMNAAKANLDTITNNLTTAKTDLANATSQKAIYESQLPALQAAVSTASTQYSAAETNWSNASSDKNSKQSTFNSAQNALTSKQSEVTNKQNAITSKQAEIDAKQTQLNSAQTQTEKDQISIDLNNLKSQLATLNTELTSLRSEAAQLETAKNSASTALDNANKNLSVAEAEKQNAYSAKQNAENAVSSKNAEINSEQSKISSANSQINNLTFNQTQAKNSYDFSVRENSTRIANEASAKTAFDSAQADYNSKNASNDAVEDNAQRLFNDYRNHWLQVSQAAKDVVAQKNLISEHVSDANKKLGELKNIPGEIDGKINTLSDHILASQKLSWTGNTYAVTENVDISSSERSELTSYSNVAISANGQVVLPVTEAKTVHLIDKLFGGSLDVATDYAGSIPYLESTSSTEVKKYTEVVNGKDVYTKKEADVTFGTEGIISVLNFNIQNGDGAVALLRQNMEDKRTEFNNNIEKYINQLRKYLS